MTSVTREHAAGTVPCILVIPKDFHVMKDSVRDPSVQAAQQAPFPSCEQCMQSTSACRGRLTMQTHRIASSAETTEEQNCSVKQLSVPHCK